MSSILSKLALVFVKKNKLRTISAGIGIALAAIMMTVIVILATSVTSSMIASAEQKYGSWHIMCENFTEEQLSAMESDGLIEGVCYVENEGYMNISSPVNSAKPYIHLANVSENYPEYLNCNVLSGRMPKNNDEIVVTAQYASDYADITIGSSFVFDFGTRISTDTGAILWQNSSYLGEGEQIISQGQTKTFTIVGIVDSTPSVEYGFSPGYTILTGGIDAIGDNTKSYLKLNNISVSLNKLTNYLSEDNIIYNTQLLNYIGATGGESFQTIIATLVIVLIAIIGIAAFILIANSLMTSSDERNKQFGILFSVGMTRLQTIKMYLIEVLCTGIFAILIGLLGGIAFAYLCFPAIGKIIATASYLDLSLKVNLNVLYLFAVFLVSLGILVIAAMYSSVQTVRGTALTKIKAGADIRLPKEKTKKAEKKYKLSAELDFVYSSFKRYHKKYSYMLFSLIFSAVLFVSAGLFGGYAENYIHEIMPTAEYDIQATARVPYPESNAVYQTFSALEEVSSSGKIYSMDAGFISIEGTDLDENFQVYARNHGITEISAVYLFIDDDSFYEIMGGQDHVEEDSILIYESLSYYINGEEQIYNMFYGDDMQFTLLYMDSEQRAAYYQTGDLQNNSTAIPIIATRTDDNLPLELSWLKETNGVYLIIPNSRLQDFSKEMPTVMQMYFCAADHTTTANKMQQIGEENGWNISVTDVSEGFEKEQSTYAMIELFAMMFTILISIVSIINAFNSVSANLLKRRKEFAVLQSIGMSVHSLYKIIAYECLLLCTIVIIATGCLTPIISVILSISFPVARYKFIFPWQYLLIAAGCLFCIFVCSSIYPLYRIKRQNVIQTIKNGID